MTDRFETYEQYISVCQLHKKDQNALAVTIFENDGLNLSSDRYCTQFLISYLIKHSCGG